MLELPKAPRFGRPFAGGVPRIDFSHPLAVGLTVLWVAGYCQMPLFVRGKKVIFPGNSISTYHRSGPMGACATGTLGFGLAGLEDTSSNYVLPAAGTMAMYHTINTWSPTDGADHIGGVVGTALSSNAVQMEKFSDNNFYCGHSNNRVVVAAAGSFAAGDTFSSGVSWDGQFANQQLYVKGRQLGAITGGATQTLGSGLFSVCIAGGSTWIKANDYLYLFVFSERKWTAADWEMFERDPTCFLIYPDDDVYETVVGTASSAAVLPPWLFENMMAA